MKSSAILLLSLCSAFADTAKVTQETFAIRPTLSAALLPTEVTPLRIDAEQWATFTILEIAPHGSLVKKDQQLVRFDDQDFQKKLRDARSAAEAGKLNFANAEADFISAEKYHPMQLQSTKMKAEEAAEAWEYFQKTRREVAITEANLNLRQSELRLDSEREELHQLEKMYKADDLTENTEEIILKRQRESVKFAEVAVEHAKLTHKRTLELTIPREAIELERAAEAAAIALKENEQNLPRNLEIKRLALEDARVTAQRTAENLAKLEIEKDLFALKAPADGYFYYGNIQDGRWSTGDPAKAIQVNAPIAPKRTFAVLVPSNAQLALETTVEESVMRQLKPEQKGFATLTGAAETSFPVSISAVSATPNIDNRYRVTLTGTFPADLPVVAGMGASAQITAYEKENALTIPTKALHNDNKGGWEVEISEGEGDAKKTKRIPVTRGKSSGDKVEILSGLTKDQVIITPGA
jgi:multidrug efflux pump subunit AcrA (membrane-fusion protein)